MKIKKFLIHGKVSPSQKWHRNFGDEVTYDFSLLQQQYPEVDQREEQATEPKESERGEIFFSDSFRETFRHVDDEVESGSTTSHENDKNAEDEVASLNEYTRALVELHKTLRSVLDESNGNMNPKCAEILCRMGEMYFSRSQEDENCESERDARRAKASYMVASRIYELYSMKVESDFAMKKVEKARELEHTLQCSVNCKTLSLSSSSEKNIEDSVISISASPGDEKADAAFSDWYSLFQCCGDDVRYSVTFDEPNCSISQDEESIVSSVISEKLSNDLGNWVSPDDLNFLAGILVNKIKS